MIRQKGKGEGIACGEDHQVDVVLDSAILKNHTGAAEPAYIWLDQDSAGDDAVRQIIVHHGVLAKQPEGRIWENVYYFAQKTSIYP